MKKMYLFKFFVHCRSWEKDGGGGYENSLVVNTKREAKEVLDMWNKESVEKHNGDFHVDLVSLEEIQ